MFAAVLRERSSLYTQRRKFLPVALILFVVCTLMLGVVFAPPADAAGSEEQAFLQLINQYRAENGVHPLQLSPMISGACYRHNSDMGKFGFFDHYTERSDWFAAGASPWDRMAASGYDYNTHKGENIAAGYATAVAVFTAWKNSPG